MRKAQISVPLVGIEPATPVRAKANLVKRQLTWNPLFADWEIHTNSLLQSQLAVLLLITQALGL